MRRVCYITVLALCLTTVLLPFASKAQADDLDYTPEQIKNTSAESFLERIEKPEPGYHQFSALNALSKKIKESDPGTRLGMLNLVIKVMNDKSCGDYLRFQCCYVISGSGDERGIPYLAEVLFSDPSVTVRSVAAEALGQFPNNAEAKSALVQASKQEKDAKVLEAISRLLTDNDAEYTPEQIKSISTETFIERLYKTEPGYDKFAAMHALAKKAKESDPQTRISILNLVVTAMNDTTKDQRWQCCYIISDCGDEQWIPYLVDVIYNDPSQIVRSVAAGALGMFKNSSAAKEALRKAAQDIKNASVLEVINRALNAGNAEYTPEQIKSISAEAFLAKMEQSDVGYDKFAAMHALGKKARDSDANARKTILDLVVKAMNDTSRVEFQRFQCCYVISDCGDEQWVPYLVDVLLKDASATMRSVAAEALGKFPNSATAHDALVQAARQETNQKVIDVLTRVLGMANSAS